MYVCMFETFKPQLHKSNNLYSFINIKIHNTYKKEIAQNDHDDTLNLVLKKINNFVKLFDMHKTSIMFFKQFGYPLGLF